MPFLLLFVHWRYFTRLFIVVSHRECLFFFCWFTFFSFSLNCQRFYFKTRIQKMKCNSKCWNYTAPMHVWWTLKQQTHRQHQQYRHSQCTLTDSKVPRCCCCMCSSSSWCGVLCLRVVCDTLWWCGVWQSVHRHCCIQHQIK